MRIKLYALVAGLVLFCSVNANAAIFELAATLTPGAEVPAVPTPAPNAAGSAAMVLDSETGMFAYIIDFKGLTGGVTVAHFHEAPVGEPGGVVFDLANDPDADFTAVGATQGIFSGSTTLEMEEVNAILNNLWYINIHTAANPAGEIRGQVLGGRFSPIPIPAAAWLFLSGLAGLLLIKR